MKKVLLIGFIIFCIFQMMVMATAIDIGNSAIDRNSTRTQYYTVVDKNNPANASGTITTVKIWTNTELAGCEVAIFTEGASNVFTTRDYETVNNGNGAGVVLAGSEQTFTVSLNVVTGDYIGMYWTSGTMEKGSSGASGYWKKGGDEIPCTDTTFSFTDVDDIFSVGGTGATAGITWNAQTISKWNGATISKWNGM